TLATVGLLARVVSARASDLGRLDGLAVDDRRTGRCVATFLAPELVAQRIVDPLPRTVVAPDEEDPVDGFPVWEVVRQEPPCATAAEDVEDRVDDRPTTNRLGPSAARRLWQEFAKNLPLLVGNVRGIVRLFRMGHRYDSFRSWLGNRRVSYRFSLV